MGSELLGLAAMSGALWLLLAGLRQRDSALRAVRWWCWRNHLQLLDDNVIFCGWRWCRQEPEGNAGRGSGWLAHGYRFEISSNGQQRRDGLLLMRGQLPVLLQVMTDDGYKLIEYLPANQPAYCTKANCDHK